MSYDVVNAISDIDSLKAEISTLNESNDRLSDNISSYLRQLREHADKVDAFKSRLIEAVKDSDIEVDLAKEFAEIFDLSLTETKSITITASWSGTVEVFVGIDTDSLEVEVDYPEISYSCEGFEDLSVDEDSLEVETSDY